MTNRYRHVIWDWNGTLLDDVDHSLSTTNGMLQEHAQPPLDLDRYREVFDFPVSDYYRRIGFDFSRVPFTELAAVWVQRYMAGSEQCILRGDARETLAAISARGVTQSILSALEQSRLSAQVAWHSLSDHFVACVGVDDDLGAGKVGRGQQWLAEANVDPDTVLLVGDTTHDFEVAAELRVDCVLVLGGHHNEKRLGAKTRVMPDLAAVLACL